MTSQTSQIQSAFVTGATGLLGNNLVRLLVSRGVSLATARLMIHERNRTRFNHIKSEQELGVRFRPVEETLRGTIAWYRGNGWLQGTTKRKVAMSAAGGSTC